MEFVKIGYKRHKIIRLYAKVELWEVVVQIEGNLRTKCNKRKLKSKECIFVAKHGLNSKMRIRPNWSLILGREKHEEK